MPLSLFSLSLSLCVFVCVDVNVYVCLCVDVWMCAGVCSSLLLSPSLSLFLSLTHTLSPSTHTQGCSVLYMVRNYLGEEVFLQGLRLFLNTYSFSNANSANFWTVMSTVSSRAGKVCLSLTHTHTRTHYMHACTILKMDNYDPG